MNGVTYTGFTAARTWRFAGRWDRAIFVWFAAMTVFALATMQWALALAWFLLAWMHADQTHDRFKIRALEEVAASRADVDIEVFG